MPSLVNQQQAVIQKDEHILELNKLNQSKEITHLQVKPFPTTKPHIEVEYHIGPCLGLLILFCNLIIPGTGTFIACCKMKDPILKKQLCHNGLCQILTWPLFVGWVIAQVYSCTILGISCFKPVSIEYNRPVEKLEIDNEASKV